MNFYDSTDIPCFGVAGNFTGHLEQAGEAIDFANVKTKEANEPKAIFPTYIPSGDAAPQFLKVFPFDSKKIIFPENEEKLQIEPECALVFDAEWKDKKLVNLKPVCFGASNDCSIRKQGAILQVLTVSIRLIKNTAFQKNKTPHLSECQMLQRWKFIQNQLMQD